MLNEQKQLERASQVPGAELERRISALVALFKSRTEAARVAGLSTDQLLRYERGGTPSFPPLARLAIAKGVSLEWLAIGDGEMYEHQRHPAPEQGSQALRREELMMALQLASEALGNKVLPPDKHAELVTLLYELLEEGLPEAKVLRFARHAASA